MFQKIWNIKGGITIKDRQSDVANRHFEIFVFTGSNKNSSRSFVPWPLSVVGSQTPFVVVLYLTHLPRLIAFPFSHFRRPNKLFPFSPTLLLQRKIDLTFSSRIIVTVRKDKTEIYVFRQKFGPFTSFTHQKSMTTSSPRKHRLLWGDLIPRLYVYRYLSGASIAWTYLRRSPFRQPSPPLTPFVLSWVR